jgi:hypothetical protein
MGMVNVADHTRRLIVTQINENGSEQPYGDPVELGNNNHVTIATENPTPAGVSKYQPDIVAFDRLADTGDPEDFRWITDLQGPLLHGRELSMRRDDEDYQCKPKILISDGIFYTHSKTTHQYFRHPRKGSTGIVRLGKLADRVGADIVCDPTRGMVTVKIDGIKTFTLENKDLKIRYRIDIRNLCSRALTESDFPQYYRVTRDVDRIEFDLHYERPHVVPITNRPLEEFLKERLGCTIPLPPGFEKLGANGPPQVCNVAFMGHTNVIP